jgi:glutamate--cysteine ligase
MFLFRRGERFVRNTGQTFRSFLTEGFEGHRATLEDFAAHLATLFPEVRLKSTLELRAIDAQQPALSLAMIALFTGVLYDERALDEAEELTAGFRFEDVEAARPRLLRGGPREEVLGRSAFAWGERLVEISSGGLERRGRSVEGRDERVYLEPLVELLERRTTPAEIDLARVAEGATLIEATRLRGLES